MIDGHGSQDLLGRRQLLGRAQIVFAFLAAAEQAAFGEASEQLLGRARLRRRRLRIELLQGAGAPGVMPTARQRIETSIEEVLAGKNPPQAALDAAAADVTKAITDYNRTVK